MGHLLPFEDKRPLVADDAFIAPTAVLIGDVVVEEGASVWFGAVLRGDFNRIVVGSGTSVQDNSVIHTSEDLPTMIGSNVTVGHLSLLEGCEIEDGALIGMGSIVLNQEIPPEVLAAGVPAEVKKDLGGSSSEWVEMAAREYQALRLKYMERPEYSVSEIAKGDA
jgi:carbonic anhydrase/acetyltransferase-like protein (isoleucine patch superfamily)